MSTLKETNTLVLCSGLGQGKISVNPEVLGPVYLLQCVQGVGIHFSDIVGFCDSIKVLTNRVDIHQAVVCHLHTLEVGEKPRNRKRFGLVKRQTTHAFINFFAQIVIKCLKSVGTYLEKMFLQGSG